MQKILPLVVSLGLVVYPLLVYFSLNTIRPEWLIAGLLSLVALRYLVVPARGRRMAALSLIVIGVAVVVVMLLAGEVTALRFYPVAANAVVFVAFAGSLLSKQPLIERIARMREPELPAHAVSYTRRLTVAWSVLIFCNGLMALYTALFSSMAIWALYNGLLSYLILGAFFLLEWLYRQRFIKSATRV